MGQTIRMPLIPRVITRPCCPRPVRIGYGENFLECCGHKWRITLDIGAVIAVCEDVAQPDD